MAYPKKAPAAQFHVNCSVETKNRFNSIHEALGYQTKAETFAAIVYTISVGDTLDPRQMDRMESKLDRLIAFNEDLA